MIMNRPRVQPDLTQKGHIPAPIGGLNTIDGLGDLPPNDCPVLWNMLRAENGLRVRLGYREWCLGLGYPTRTVWAPTTAYLAGAVVVNGSRLYTCSSGGTSGSSGGPTGTGTGITDGSCVWAFTLNQTEGRTVIGYTGSAKDRSKDRLFVCTNDGIYDCTTSSKTPSRVVTFPNATGEAGYGIWTVVVSDAGHFLLYCDEENGFYSYTESTGRWVKILLDATSAWLPTHAYVLNNQVINNGITYLCTQAGTSAGAGGPTGTGTGIVDGTVHWDYQPVISGVNPATFCYVMVWKARVWFVQKDTGYAWYTAIGFTAGGPSLYGAVTQFNFGSKFKHGGSLSGLFNWTGDGGDGIDDQLVAISGGGDIVVFAGTDPGSVATFGMHGVWYAGGVPYGRRVATDFGGDLLLLTSTGVLPLSRLVNGNVIFDRSQYATYKISNLFNQLVATPNGTVGSRKSLKGWAIRLHPQDNALVVLVPVADGQPTEQLAMDLAGRGWSRYRSLPILSADAWQGTFYFGTTDGRVCANDGYIDNLSFDQTSYSSIDFSGVTAYQNLGNARQKKLETIKVTLLQQGAIPTINCEARYRYDLTEAALPPVVTAGQAVWDSGLWDTARWGGEYVSYQQIFGAAGMATELAIAFRGQATARTVLVCMDVSFTQGGVL